VFCRDCTTNHTMLDDIVSELWREENVTSGYCPRYRYTLIATLTLGNLYYICVDFLPTVLLYVRTVATGGLAAYRTERTEYDRKVLRKSVCGGGGGGGGV
jgi:hypothetical protein